MKKARIKIRPAVFLWVLPVATLVYMHVNPMVLFIQPLEIFVSDSVCFWGFTAYNVLLLVLPLYRRVFQRSFLLEAMYILQPEFCLLFLVLAQYRYSLAWSILLCIATTSLAVYVLLNDIFEPFQPAVFARILVCMATVLLTFPSFYTLHKYQLSSPYYELVEPLWEEIFSESNDNAEDAPVKTKSEILAENPEFLQALKEDVWAELPPLKKLEVLQFVVDTETSALGLPESVPVVCYDLAGDIRGCFSPNKENIAIDLEELNTAPPEEAVMIITHECYHALQQYVVDNIEWDSPLAKTAFFNEARRWKDESDHYENGDEDFEKYYQQSLEKSARDYSEVATISYFFESKSDPA